MSESRVGDIKEDEAEYLAIVKGLIRQDLRKYLASGSVTLPTGGGTTISIVMNEIDIPTWHFGHPDHGLAQGDGDVGDDLGPVGEGEEPGEKGEGGGPSEHRGKAKMVIDLTDEEFSDFLKEALELPNIKPKGDRGVFEEHEKYNTISIIGPQSMLDKRRTLRKAIERGIVEGTFHPPDRTTISIERKDKRFRSYNVVKEPKNNAVIFFIRDVSGSMGPAERRITTYLCSLCEFWLSRNYDRLEKAYIIHDDVAERVDAHNFFHKHTGMGTICSTGLVTMNNVIEEEFPVSSWNIYGLYISDGFNFSHDDDEFIRVMREMTLPVVNQFNYAQVTYRRPWLNTYTTTGGSTFSMPGTLGALMKKELGEYENLALAPVDPENLASAIDAMGVFFKKGN